MRLFQRSVLPLCHFRDTRFVLRLGIYTTGALFRYSCQPFLELLSLAFNLCLSRRLVFKCYVKERIKCALGMV